MDLLWIALVGGFVALDTTAAFQIMISQPLVSGLLAGGALGDPWLGAFVGLLYQGLYMAEMPLGSRVFPDSNLGAVQAAALTVFLRHQIESSLGLALLLSLLWSLLASIVGGYVIVWMRKLHGRYLPIVDRMVISGRHQAINLFYIAVILESFLVGALFTAVWFILGQHVLAWLVKILPAQGTLAEWGMTLRGSLLGAGCAVIFITLMGKIRGGKRWLVLSAFAAIVGIWAVGY